MLEKDRAIAARRYSRLDRWLWAWFSTKTVLLGFLIAFALAMAISILVPQAPKSVRYDPASYQQWRSEALRQYQRWTPLFEAIGIFHVRDSAWFYVLLALLTFALFLSAGREIGQLWTSHLCSPDEQARAPVLLSLAGSAEVPWAIDHVRVALTGLFRTVDQQKADNHTYLLCARRGMWLSYALPIAYVGMLLVITSVAVNGRWGWEQSQVRLFRDRQVATGPSGSHQIGLLADPPEFHLLMPDGSSAALQTNHSVRQSGYRYLLVEAGNPLVVLTARDRAGQELTLYDYAVRPKAVQALEFAFSAAEQENERDRLFIVAGEKAVGRLQWLPETGVPETAGLLFHLWVFEEDGQTLIGDQQIRASDQTASIPIGDVMYTLKVSRYAVVDVAYEPGTWPLRMGIALLVVGIIGSLLPRQRMWVTVRAQDSQTWIDVRDISEGVAWFYRRRRQRLLGQLGVMMSEKCADDSN